MSEAFDILSEARAAAPTLYALREALHREPEPGNHEDKTAVRIEAFLAELDIPTVRPFGTAVVGTLKGGLPGPVAALRADMDALPLTEETGVEFRSQHPGFMHACGHDVHMTAALGAAKLLAARRESLPGTVLFLFQPDEEGDGGAERLVKAGCLDGADAVFGAHVSPSLPLGHVGVRYGKFYAAADLFHARVRGRSCHGAKREDGVDALAAAAEMVPALLSLPESLPAERSVVNVGIFRSGTADNIVPGEAEFRGILRTLGPAARAAMNERLRTVIGEISDRHGTRTELRLWSGYPGVVNEDGMTRFVQETAAALLGPERVHVIEEASMTTEDFGYYLEKCPGSYYHIGAGCPLPLHSTGFLPDRDAAVYGAAVHAAVLAAFLSR